MTGIPQVFGVVTDELLQNLQGSPTGVECCVRLIGHVLVIADFKKSRPHAVAVVGDGRIGGRQ